MRDHRLFRLIAPVLALCLLMTLIAWPVPSAHASPAAEIEPNNSAGQAQPISTIGVYSPIEGSIGAAQDVDYYRFEAVQGRSYTIELFNAAAALAETGYYCNPGINAGDKGLGLFVYSPAQAQVTGQCDAAGRSAGNIHHSESFTAASSGTFYIKVIANNSSATGFYSLRVLPRYNEPGGAEWDARYEPNTTTRNAYPITPGYANALTADVELRDPRYATYAPDQDWYRFEAIQGRTYVIELFNVASALGAPGAICSSPFIWDDKGLFMAALNPSGTEVAKQCNANDATHSAGNVHHYLEITASVSGIHYVLVKPNDATVSGFYSIRVLPKYGQPGADWDPVSYEPNNSIWNSYPIKPGLDSWMSGQIDLRDPTYSTFFADQDWYRLENVIAGQTYEVELFNVIGSALGANTCINVYDAARTKQVGNCAGGPTGLNTVNRRVQFVPSLNGTYLINIAPGDQSATGSYSLLVCEGACPTDAPPKPTGPTWLALLYLAGDNDAPGANDALSLSADMIELLNRLQGMTYNPDMRLVVLFDGDKAGGGDTRIYTRDQSGLVDITEEAADSPYWLGGIGGGAGARELDTGSPATLSTFVTWARRAYPGTRYTMLSIVDHGGGWAPDTDPPGQPHGSDTTQAGSWRGMSLDLTTSGGSSLSTRDLGQALHDAGHIDVLFLDACLMGMIENAYEVRDYADYMVAGENTLFAGLPYQDYLAKNGLTSSTAPLDLARRLVDRYNVGTTVQQAPVAISALDLRQLRSVISGNLPIQLNILAGRLLAALPAAPAADTPLVQALSQIYSQSQKFDYDSSLTLDQREGYVDLVDFASRLRDTSLSIPSDIRSAAGDVVEAATGVTPVIIRSRTQSGSYKGASWNLSGAKGLSIFLPLGEQDYRPTLADPLNPSKPLQPERQLSYYADPTQLMFARDVSNWAALLVRLEPTVLIIRTGTDVLAGAASLNAGLTSTTDARAFRTPAQIVPEASYTLSGSVRTEAGNGVAGVTVSASGGHSATTASDGSYTLSLPAGGYTLTPSLSGYTFSPASKQVTVGGNLSGQNFTAKPSDAPLIKVYLPLTVR